MNNTQTLEQLNRMRLFGMYEWLKNAIETGVIHDFSGEELAAHLTDAEYENRYNRRLERLIKNAAFRFVAQLEDVTYSAGRNLNKGLIVKIGMLEWLHAGQHVIVTGLTGTGKTFLACAIGMKACMHGYRVGYYGTNRFFHQLKYAKACGNYLKELKKIQKNDLIILDDFGLDVLDKESRMSLFELLEERSERKSILIADLGVTVLAGATTAPVDPGRQPSYGFALANTALRA
jgi:DNA replication protein DnaC